jgi:hypothetical protein
VNTKKGEALFDEASEYLDVEPCVFEDIALKNPNLLRPSAPMVNQEHFFHIYKTKGIGSIIGTYGHTSVTYRIKNAIRIFMKKWGIRK